MNAHDHDPLLDAFERRLATVERFIPVRTPALDQSVERPAIKVVGGSAVRRTRRGDRNRVGAWLLAPIGIAAVIVLAVVGVGYLSRPGSGPGAGPSVGSSSAPAAICAGSPIPSHPQAVSSPCRYRSTAFQPPLELQVDPVWKLAVDTTHELAFQTDLSTKPEIGTLTIATLDNISQTPCLASGGAGPTRPWAPSAPADGPRALMDWIESGSGVPHSPPSPITIDGHAGLETVLSPGVGSLQPCGGVVHLMSLGAAGRDLQIRENEAVRIDAIVVGDRTVVVITQAPRAVLSGDLDTKADRIIATIAFR